jgi:hypothetical protein
VQVAQGVAERRYRRADAAYQCAKIGLLLGHVGCISRYCLSRRVATLPTPTA